MHFGRKRKETKRPEKPLVVPTTVELNSDLLMKRAETEHGERLHMQRQVEDLVELLEEALIEHGNKHATDCEKQLVAGAPCSCGFASLVKARLLASKIRV
jgi:hypothetical protein